MRDPSLTQYRHLSDRSKCRLRQSDPGDDAIVDGYVRYDENHHKKPFLLGTGYSFIEKANNAGIPAQYLRFQSTFPRRVTTSWDVVADMLYYLAILFGVLVLPKATLYGAWSEKADLNWQHREG